MKRIHKVFFDHFVVKKITNSNSITAHRNAPKDKEYVRAKGVIVLAFSSTFEHENLRRNRVSRGNHSVDTSSCIIFTIKYNFDAFSV